MKNRFFTSFVLCLLCFSEKLYAIEGRYTINDRNIGLLEHVSIYPEGRKFQLNISKCITDLYIETELSNQLINNLGNFFPDVTTIKFGEDAYLNDEKAKLFAGQDFYFLIHLVCSENVIGNEGAKAIATNFPRLISLDLSANVIGDEGIKSIIENLEDLIFLDVSGNKISDNGVENIADKLKKLEWFFIDRNCISAKGAKSISKLPNLTSLKIANNYIGNDGIRGIAKNAKKLTQLNVSYNKISVGGAEIIASDLKNLESLNICGNPIKCEGAQAILDHLKSLSRFVIFLSDINHSTRHFFKLI
jgi:Leucine-rich repeat (LRR) protein